MKPSSSDPKGYNGWSNYDTWLVNMWFGEYSDQLQSEGVELDQGTIKELVEETMPIVDTGMWSDVLNSFSPNWAELREHYTQEVDQRMSIHDYMQVLLMSLFILYTGLAALTLIFTEDSPAVLMAYASYMGVAYLLGEKVHE